jgi:3-deoxy-D-manno-octulosonic-acid transferase
VPRHPDRAPAIRKMLEERGLTVSSRSAGEVITPQTDVFLGDSIGEMGLYLRLAGHRLRRQVAFGRGRPESARSRRCSARRF